MEGQEEGTRGGILHSHLFLLSIPFLVVPRSSARERKEGKLEIEEGEERNSGVDLEVEQRSEGEGSQGSITPSSS